MKTTNLQFGTAMTEFSIFFNSVMQHGVNKVICPNLPLHERNIHMNLMGKVEISRKNSYV